MRWLVARNPRGSRQAIPLLAQGTLDVAAQWGGGVGRPNFTKIMQAGGRLVGLSDDQTKTINANYPFVQPLTNPVESCPGQAEPLQTVGSFSFLLAHPDLPEELAHRLTKAIHQGQPKKERYEISVGPVHPPSD